MSGPTETNRTGGDGQDAGHGPVRSGRALGLWIASAGAVAAMMARQADSSPLIPFAIQSGLQLPAIGLWLAWQCGRGRGRDRVLTAGVLFIALAAGVWTRSVDLAAAMLTSFIAAMLALDALAAWLRRIEQHRGPWGHLARDTALGWLILIAVGTALLATPLSTHSAVPDYRHNFWRHVLWCGYTATSAACLTGVTAYEIGADYSLLGRVLVFAIMQAGAAAVSALGLVAARPILPRPVRLRTVLLAAWGLQLLAGLVLAWRCDPSDAAGGPARLAWGVFHAAAALYNCGYALRPDGMATYFGSTPVYVCLTALMIVGSLGLPLLLSVAGRRGPTGRAERGGKSTEGRSFDSAESPVAKGGRVGVANLEFALAFWLLLVGAGLLFVCETPGNLPAALVPDPPMEMGPNQVRLADLPARGRWTQAVFLSADARSTGMAGVPLGEGAVNWVSFGVLALWMFVGGGVGSFAGGVRTTTLLAFLVWPATAGPAKPSASDRDARHIRDVSVSRRYVVRNLLPLVLGMFALAAAAPLAMMTLYDATFWEIVFDTWSALFGVGWSTGIAPHLTWPARSLMIVLMLVGRLFPLWWWSRLALSIGGDDSTARRR